jgi:type I restriction enzyme S subunit
MECGGNDAALAGHALGPVPENTPSPQRTEEGDHPESATETTLGAVAELLMGNSPPGETYNAVGVGLPLINGPAEYGPRHPKPVKWTSAPARICKPGDVLICVRGNTTGKLNIADNEYCIGRGVAAVRGKPSESDTEFLSFVLQWKADRILELATGGGSTFPNINKPQLEELPVPGFALPEQRAIAGVLRTVQGAKEACEQVLAATRQLKQSLLHHLFTHGPVPFPKAAHVPLRGTEIGEIPAHWEVVPLGVGFSVFSGFAFKSQDFKTEGIPVIKIGNLQNGTVVINKDTSYFPRQLVSSAHGKFALHAGDVLIAMTGATTGKVSTLPANLEGAMLNQRVGKIALREESQLLLDFVKRFVVTPFFQTEIQENILKSAQGNISPKSIERILVPRPPLPEQQQIAAQLAALDAKLAAEESRRTALAALFQSLLHHLMTGRVRLPEFVKGQS